MIDRIRNLKITDIFFLILLSCFFIFLMTAEREGPENMREQIAQHEPWLTNTSNYISDYMNEPKVIYGYPTMGLVLRVYILVLAFRQKS